MSADVARPRHTHIGVYALLEQENSHEGILLIRKARGPYTGCWDLPGGRIEFGETPEEALRREVREETGLAIVGTPRLLTVLSHSVVWSPEPGVDEALHHIGILYQATVEASPHRSTPDGEDSLGASWFSREDLPDLTPFAQRLLHEFV